MSFTSGVTDNADRTNGDMGANWTFSAWDGGTGLQIVSNAIKGSNTFEHKASLYTAKNVGSSAEVSATMVTMDTGAINVVSMLLFNGTSSTPNGYCLAYNGSTHVWRLQKVVSGVQTNLGSGVTQLLSSGDKMGLLRNGNSLESWYCPSGGSWTKLEAIVDTTTMTTAFVGGMEIYSTTQVVDDFTVTALNTRYYFPSTGAAACSPTFGGGTSSGWGMTTGADRLEAVTIRINSSMTNKVSNGSGNNQGLSPLVRQYVSKSIGAQTIIGTIKGQARALESSTSNNQRARLIVYVVSGDGATVRGVLYEGSDTIAGSNPTGEFNTSLRNAKFPWISESPATLSSVTAQNGDRIVFEWGANKENFSATGRTVTISFGDNSGTNLAEDEITTTANNPWIEFSQTITDPSGAVVNSGFFGLM